MNNHIKIGLYFVFVWLFLVSLLHFIGRLFLERYGLEYRLLYLFGGLSIYYVILIMFLTGMLADFILNKLKKEFDNKYLLYYLTGVIILVIYSVPSLINLINNSWGLLGIPFLIGSIVIIPLFTAGIFYIFEIIQNKSKILEKSIFIFGIILIICYICILIVPKIDDSNKIQSCPNLDLSNKLSENMTVEELLYRLSESYDDQEKTNSPVIMIRVSGELFERWENKTPLIQEIEVFLNDNCLNDQTRLYILKSLSNKIGGNVYTKEESLIILDIMKKTTKNLRTIKSRYESDSNYHHIAQWVRR